MSLGKNEKQLESEPFMHRILTSQGVSPAQKQRQGEQMLDGREAGLPIPFWLSAAGEPGTHSETH